MKHEMHLNKKPFCQISGKEKTIELRLNDEKRKKISVGDEIRFICDQIPDMQIEAKVIALHYFASFKELYESLPLEKCGYTRQSRQRASFHDMDRYYSAQEQEKYGVVGIEIELL